MIGQAETLAPAFAALGDRTRLSLLTKLGDGQPRSIARLAANATVTRQAVTKHLGVLENAGLVSRSQVGRESRYRLRADTVAELGDYLQSVSAEWDAALLSLKSVVEE